MSLPFKPPERWTVTKNDPNHIVMANGDLSLKIARPFKLWDIELMDFRNGTGNGAICLDRAFEDNKPEAISEACRMMSEN